MQDSDYHNKEVYKRIRIRVTSGCCSRGFYGIFDLDTCKQDSTRCCRNCEVNRFIK